MYMDVRESYLQLGFPLVARSNATRREKHSLCLCRKLGKTPNKNGPLRARIFYSVWPGWTIQPYLLGPKTYQRVESEDVALTAAYPQCILVHVGSALRNLILQLTTLTIITDWTTTTWSVIGLTRATDYISQKNPLM